MNSVWAKDASFLFLGSTGFNFPLGTSRCVSSNHLTGAALKSFKDSCQPKLFQGSLSSWTSPLPQQIGAAPLLQGKVFSQVSLKSLELLHSPSLHSRLNMHEKPPQESPEEQERWRESRTQNGICGSGRASSCPCHPGQHRYLVFSSRFSSSVSHKDSLGGRSVSHKAQLGMRWSKWDKHNWKMCCTARPGDSNSVSLIASDCFLARAQPARAVRFYKHSHTH